MAWLKSIDQNTDHSLGSMCVTIIDLSGVYFNWFGLVFQENKCFRKISV